MKLPIFQWLRPTLGAARRRFTAQIHTDIPFLRVPQVIFEGMVEVDDLATTEHFESIQSTNWQTVRWKPPPMKANACSPHVGWRTEPLSLILGSLPYPVAPCG